MRKLAVLIEAPTGQPKTIDYIDGTASDIVESLDFVEGIAGSASLNRTTPGSDDPTTFRVVKAFDLEGDQGGGQFYWIASYAGAVYQGMIVRPVGAVVGAWFRLYGRAPINVRWCGAKLDSVADDTVPYEQALLFLDALSGGGIYTPTGTARLTRTLHGVEAVYWSGDGPGASRLHQVTTGLRVVEWSNVARFGMQGLAVQGPTDDVGAGVVGADALLIEVTSTTAERPVFDNVTIDGFGRSVGAVFTVDHGTSDTLLTTVDPNDLAVDDEVWLDWTSGGGALPTGLSVRTLYYVLTTPTTSTFTVSLTAGGAPVVFADDGTGAFSVVPATGGMVFRSVGVGFNVIEPVLRDVEIKGPSLVGGQIGVWGVVVDGGDVVDVTAYGGRLTSLRIGHGGTFDTLRCFGTEMDVIATATDAAGQAVYDQGGSAACWYVGLRFEFHTIDVVVNWSVTGDDNRLFANLADCNAGQIIDAGTRNSFGYADGSGSLKYNVEANPQSFTSNVKHDAGTRTQGEEATRLTGSSDVTDSGILAPKVLTVDATSTEVLSTAQLTPYGVAAIQDNSVVTIQFVLKGFRTGGAAAGAVGDVADFVLTATAKIVAGALTISQVVTSYSYKDDTNWGDPVVAADGASDVKCNAVGLAAANITWSGSVSIVDVKP